LLNRLIDKSSSASRQVLWSVRMVGRVRLELTTKGLWEKTLKINPASMRPKAWLFLVCSEVCKNMNTMLLHNGTGGTNAMYHLSNAVRTVKNFCYCVETP
jgi:hypothetical protein